MRYKSAIYIILTIVVILIAGNMAVAQTEEEKATRPEVDSSMALSPDFLPTRLAPMPTVSFNPLEFKTIDTTLFAVSDYDPLLQTHNLYQSLGINGQAHKTMIFSPEREMGFSWITLPYPLYFKKMSDLQIYDLKTSFTNIDFIYGLTREFTFRATHAQHIRQTDFTVSLDGASNEGYFIHQGLNRLSISATARYETPKKIYGFLLAYIYNRGKYAENGGLEYSPDFTDRDPHDSTLTYDLSSFPVMLSNAQTILNTHAIQLLNYVNIKDKQGRYFGTISHTFDFNHQTSVFSDYDLNDMFYRSRYYVNTDTTYDSLRFYSLANALQWSNYSPVDTVSGQPYYFRIAGGVRHEYVNLFVPAFADNSLTLFARTSIRLFKIWEIFGDISYSLFGYTRNDALANVGARFTINPKHRHYVGIEASFNHFQPDYLFSHYAGNNNQWDYDWQKQNLLKLGAYWTILGYRVGFNFFHADRYVFLQSDFTPTQLDKPVEVFQLLLSAPVRTKHFALNAEMAIQHSTNKAITVPLFAGKASALFTTRIFKKRLRLQIGVDLFYNTEYYADGYNPILHQFYAQQYIITGNYLYLNAHLALRVKRLSFFVRGGNLIAGLMSFRYITTPGYPMQGRSFQVGVNWKFYD